MKRPTNCTYVALLSLLFLDPLNAFQAPSIAVGRQSSALHLLPGQGNQLAAAFNAACEEKKAEKNASSAPTTNTKQQPEESKESHRSIVSRIFHLPSVKRKLSSEADEEQLRRSEGQKHFTFYDGPPFATGLPHYGHIAAGTIKDIVTRYAT